ncbi:helix-turn-helix transcriptional regulator [Azospirillum sp. HJ39]|uniref:helix-turn-helix domain-containing protein n=1 Tax=Azospirillum sp. HJ39 TaxID=3159496 RepID=UPI0035579051
MVCYEDTRTCIVSHHGLLAAWAETSAELVEAIEDPVFPSVFSRSLATLISFDECTRLLYDGDGPPVPGRDGRDRPPSGSEHRDSGSVPHPFHRMYRAGIRSGVYLRRDIVRFGRPTGDAGRLNPPAGPAGDLDRLPDGMPDGNDELCICLPMSGTACTLMVLTRKRSRRGFTEEEAGNVRAVLPFLTTVFRRHWQSAGLPADSQDDRIDCGLLQRIERLSPREKEIVGLLIGGHSTLSISLRLDISGTTVKTHRKNLYSKLGVGTIHELFSLYGNSLRERMARSY